MVDLVPQRTRMDCAIASIAMATERPYEEVRDAGINAGAFHPDRGTIDKAPILRRLGYSDAVDADGDPIGDIYVRSFPTPPYPGLLRSLVWGRRALLTVTTQSGRPGGHLVFWDGSRLLDPWTALSFERLNDLEVWELILFREAGGS